MKKLCTTEKLNKKIEEKHLSQRKLAKMIDYDDAGINAMILGKQSMSKAVKEKLLPILEISEEEFESWILADKYPKELLALAIKNKKDFPYKRKSMLTTKIDDLLHEKGISRTTLSKEINYSQSGLNSIIVGKRTLSKSVLKKLANFFNIPENELLSWTIADKYSIKMLELAYSC